MSSSPAPPDSEFRPPVSVIVPIYNGEADLPGLLAALQAQTYPRDRVEYLLVDNNSGDRTADLIRAAAHNQPNIRLLQELAVQSSYAARNCGIRAARHDLLAFTDADCRPIPAWLEQLVQPFQQPTIGLVVGEIAGLPGATWLERHAERHNVLSQKFTLAHPFCPYGQTANLAIRKVALTEVGLFRPYLTTGGDADICWRILRETEWQYAFAAQAVIRHRHRANLREFRSQWRRYGRSNRYLHELYGVPLMRELTAATAARRLGRWLLKELPRDGLKLALGRADWLDLVRSPIDLVGYQARSHGQQQASLPPEARQIEPFASPDTHSTGDR
ncbi:MAG: glycosyltransferase [Spirulinaceae cyanobacterium SM2_1_0]|nr:glycosyltransferase [Spirulinaceae cyanobacterium SM2_1_0]